VPLPAWFARTVQVPAPVNETTEPDRLQMPALAGAMENVTARPELAVAATVYVGPPTVAPPGGLDVKLIVWLASPTPNDCCTCGAA
jgi:hypothetical protein